MNFRSTLSLGIASLLLVPATVFALEGVGPRVTVTGTVVEVRISKTQAYEKQGGTIIVKATNGQIVTMELQNTASLITEGRTSRKQMIPVNITPGMRVRVRGWRIDAQTLSASLVILLNLETNPELSLNGVIDTIDGSTLSVLNQDGVIRSFTVTNETLVNISYELTGSNALNLVGKQVLLTLNPADPTLIRVLRITGDTPIIKSTRIR